MARHPRVLSEGNVYHVMARGVNHMTIFEDDRDRLHFLSLLEELSLSDGVELFCWCLMGNHFHILLRAEMSTLSTAMKNLLAGYASYFNRRHDRSGHVFQDRFRSEAIDTDEYLLAAVRYIHWNPVKAGLSKTCSYTWSSYGEYCGVPKICQTEWILSVFGGINAFHQAHAQEPSRKLADVEMRPTKRLSDEAVAKITASQFGLNDLAAVSALDRETRNEVLRFLRNEGASIRQLQRLTGVGKNIIART